MTILLDTNLLLRSVQPQHPSHSTARHAIQHARNLGHNLCVVPQVVYEFWVVATRPTSVNGLGLSVDRVAQEVQQALSLFPIRRDERSIFDHWQQLVETYSVAGKNAHDCRLVAAMLRHNITHLLTFNDGDFSRYHEVTAVHPEHIDTLPANK